MNSHLTAISRKALPVPTRWLLSQGMIHGRVLDYGCGKCKSINDKVFPKYPGINSITSYDPHYEPRSLENPILFGNLFDVVLCTYVLCTLPVDNEKHILRQLQYHLWPQGIAYVTVRNDEPKNGYGVSSKGTFQRRVELPYLYELRKTSQYRIYLLTKETSLV